MSKWGFVYCLSNEAMPGLFKIGYTNRSPAQRAEELSRASGVPDSFEILFYLETKTPQAIERLLHKELARYRFAQNREFFEVSDEVIAKAFRFCDGGTFMESDTYVGMIMERRFLEERNGAKGKGMEGMQ